ncbi:MAG: VOC family protein [Desulfofustis sp.]|nr:VOC family protein [Desulfofustis sp.]
MEISAIDHLVLTVADIERTARFYTTVLGLKKQVAPNGRVSLHFGRQKINLHVSGAEFMPCAARPTPGSADLCLLVRQPLEAVCRELDQLRVPLVEGPVVRMGAAGTLTSVYIRDPDGNLLELARYDEQAP